MKPADNFSLQQKKQKEENENFFYNEMMECKLVLNKNYN